MWYRFDSDLDMNLLGDWYRGKYKIKERLGKGGFGSVYLAYHNSLDRNDAIKVLNEECSNDFEFKKRFLDEARLISKLKSNGIIQIYDVEEYKNRSFYTMEYIGGTSLQNTKKEFSFSEIIRIIIQTLYALDTVHEQKLVHRDIKPDNVLLRASNEPVLIDFGIAKEIAKSKTASNSSMGTPYFMSPEQFEDSSKVDNRSDIYSIGIMLYYLLTKKYPFVGNDMIQIYKNHKEGKISSVGKIEIDLIIQKSCAKKREDRYSTAKEMANVLENIGKEQVAQTFLSVDKIKESKQEEVKIVKPQEKIIVPVKQEQVKIIPQKSIYKTYTNSIGIEFMYIPAGEFLMGASPNDTDAFDCERPVHKVKISKGFYMGKYPVTQEQWRAVMGNDPPELKFKGCDRCPVENVSWKDVQEYIKKLNEKEEENRRRTSASSPTSFTKYRLPSEAEWEYAARAGTKTKFYWGNDMNGDYAWYEKISESKTHPVGQKKSNAWGLYDMSGNGAMTGMMKSIMRK